jgi:uncharacterized protein
MIESITLALAIFGGMVEPLDNEHPIRTELCVRAAFTESEYSRGFKFRESLDLYEFMVFDMGQTRGVSFWMEDTPSSLDILFFDESLRLIHLAQGTTPFSRAPIAAPGDPIISYVVEMSSGTANRLDLSVDETRLHVSPPASCPEAP